jgi:uncharacterized membrane protein
MTQRVFAIIVLFIVVTFYATPIPVYAQSKAWGGCVVDNVATLSCIPVVFGNIVNAALIFVGSIAVIMLVYAGIQYVRSGGDPKQTQAAQKILTYAIIGLVVVLSSFGIIYFIGYLTGSTSCITNINAMINGGCQ